MVILIGIIMCTSAIALLVLFFTSIISREIFELEILVASVIIFAVCVLLVLIIPRETISVVSEEYGISALKDNFTIDGRGGMFYSYINEDYDYFVFGVFDDGQQMRKLDGDKAYIVETTEQPKVQIIMSKEIKNRWFWGVFDDVDKIKIFVPNGSIINQFEADLE